MRSWQPDCLFWMRTIPTWNTPRSTSSRNSEEEPTRADLAAFWFHGFQGEFKGQAFGERTQDVWLYIYIYGCIWYLPWSLYFTYHHISTMPPALSSVVDSYRMLDPSNILASPKLIRWSLTVSHFCCSIHQTYWKLKDQIQNIVQPLRTRYPTTPIYPPLEFIWVGHAMSCARSCHLCTNCCWRYPLSLGIPKWCPFGRREDQPSVAFTSPSCQQLDKQLAVGQFPLESHGSYPKIIQNLCGIYMYECLPRINWRSRVYSQSTFHLDWIALSKY